MKSVFYFSLQQNCSLNSLEMCGMFLFTRVLSVQSKMASKQQALREHVVRFYETYGHRGQKFTVDHFRDENVPLTTVYPGIPERGAEGR